MDQRGSVSDIRADTHRAVVDIVERSATLRERLSDRFDPHSAETDDTLVAARIAAWEQAVAKGNHELFDLRLSWDGLDGAEARRAVGRVRLAEGAELPEWARLLEDYLVAVGRTPPELDGVVLADDPIPFEELLMPLVQVARSRLLGRIPDPAGLVGRGALSSLARTLLWDLSVFAQGVLLRTFESERAPHFTGLSRLLTLADTGTDRGLYDGFLADMGAGALVDFLQRYPVLARHLMTMTLLWIEFAADVVRHVSEDRPELDRMFGGREPLGEVTALQASMSDPHHGRRSVATVTFESSTRLIYKPKPLGAERQFSRLVAWLNDAGLEAPLRSLRVLDRGSHGWVEFVDHVPMDGTDAAVRYYRRAGMLLCLAYVLEGTDCHYENVIASGEHPMLVDLETLMHHRGRRAVQGDGAQAQMLAGAELDHSVLRTGLLPHWEVAGADQLAFDVSGLGTEGEQRVSTLVPRWEHVNTDRMAIRLEPGRLAPRPNAPQAGDEPMRLGDHAEDLVAGFEAMYQLLVDRREELIDPEGPLYALAGERVRFVFRPTRTYALMQINLSSGQYLRDGVDRSIYLEQLARVATPSGDAAGERPPFWPLMAVEAEAMERGDIPYFAARPADDGMKLASGEMVPDIFAQPSLDLVLERIAAMGDADRSHQVGLIRASLYANSARSVIERAEPGSGGIVRSDPTTPLTRDEMLQHALAIAGRIAERATLAEDGSAAWIAPQYLVQANRYQLQPIDHSLYGGTSGVAVFLAALEHVTGGAGHSDLARSALSSLQWAARTSGDVLATVMGIGGGTGLGSAVYALVQVSRLLEAPDLMDDAAAVATLITDDLIAADRSLDVTSGSAGALLGLLALHEATGEPAALATAGAAAAHLLESRVASPAGPRTWATFEGRLTTGFSHGAAGIAYALLRLHAVTGAPELRDAALEGIAYEDSVYSFETGNWADFGQDDEELYVVSWCHGAPGIALARLGSGRYVDDAETRRDLERALHSTEAFGLRVIDHLCCGNMGRVDALLAAGEDLGRTDLVAAARSLATQAVRRAEAGNGFILHPMLPDETDNPGFFQGTAGIGYELLRLAYPGALPSILMME